MIRRTAPWLIAILTTLVCLAGPSPAESAGPLVLLGGRLRVGGLISGTIAPEDDGYFNFVGYEDYGDSTLRRFRLAVNAELRLGRRAAVLTEIWSDNLRAPRVYALLLRVRPWTDRAFDIQVGMVPPVFGTFARRRYGGDNPLPGLPLAYQYVTTMRDDAVPARAEELVSRYFSERLDDPQHGTIEIAGERYLLVRGAALSVEFFALGQKLSA